MRNRASDAASNFVLLAGVAGCIGLRSRTILIHLLKSTYYTNRNQVIISGICILCLFAII